jgi:hypothetical protein
MRTVNSAELHPVSFQTVLNPNVTRYTKTGPLMKEVCQKKALLKRKKQFLNNF